MKPVIMICYGNVELSRKAYASIMAQDVGDLRIVMVDNGSTDGTWEWMQSLSHDGLIVEHNPVNRSPVRVSNEWMERIFREWKADYVLGLPNDCVLPSNCYSQLLRFPHGFVSADDHGPENPPCVEAQFVHHGFNPVVSLVRKWAYDAMIATWGFLLDPEYFHYASDIDLQQRMARMGIQAAQTSVQCWHYGSASWRLAAPHVEREINIQADVDRDTYFRKWGEKL